MSAQRRGDRADHVDRGLLGGVEILFCQMTVAEEAFKPGYAAHRQAKQHGGVRAVAGGQLGAAAADIDHQPLVRAASGMRDALINQARFLFAADNVNRAAQNLLCGKQEFAGVSRQAQGGGRDHADLFGRNILQLFGEELQTLPAARHRLDGKMVIFVQAGSQTHLALNARDGLNASGNFAHHQHMKAVGSQINRSIK